MKASNQTVLGLTLTGSNLSFFESPVCAVFSQKRKVTSLFYTAASKKKIHVLPQESNLLPSSHYPGVFATELQTNGGNATNKGSEPPVSLNEKYPSHVFNRLKIHHHRYIAGQKRIPFC